MVSFGATRIKINAFLSGSGLRKSKWIRIRPNVVDPVGSGFAMLIIGEGRSKKDAKLACSRKALQILYGHNFEDPGCPDYSRIYEYKLL